MHQLQSVARLLTPSIVLAVPCLCCMSGAGAPPHFVAGPNSPIVVGRGPGAPAIADFDSDGKPDIVLICGSPTDPRAGNGILLLLNDGAASLSPAPTGWIDLGLALTELAVADFDRDGNADVAATGHDSYLVHLLLGDGKGGLGQAPGSPFPAHDGPRPHTHAVVAADVDADGDPDLLTTNADDNAIAVLLNDGQARFSRAPGSPFAAPGHPYSSLAVTDLDGDSKLDVAAPQLKSHEIGVYLGDGAGRFAAAPGSPYGVAARPGFVHAADLNGDGKPDLMATHDDVGMVDVLLNEGGGRFRFAPSSPVRLERMVWFIVTGDYDADGDLDAILSGYPGRSLILLLGDGRGGLVPAKGTDLEVGESPNRVASGDLDGDGRDDIVATTEERSDVTVLLRR